MSKRVELRPAFVWTCETCGRDNFHRGLVPTIQDEEWMREEHGIEPWHQGEWIVRPERVGCIHCGDVFITGDDE